MFPVCPLSQVSTITDHTTSIVYSAPAQIDLSTVNQSINQSANDVLTIYRLRDSSQNANISKFLFRLTRPRTRFSETAAKGKLTVIQYEI